MYRRMVGGRERSMFFRLQVRDPHALLCHCCLFAMCTSDRFMVTLRRGDGIAATPARSSCVSRMLATSTSEIKSHRSERRRKTGMLPAVTTWWAAAIC